MCFADKYFSKHQQYPFQITGTPDTNLNLIVVIPCFNEPQLLNSLNSIWNCTRPEKSVEIIIVVNNSENSDISVKEQNKKTIFEVKNWIKNHFETSFRFFLITQLNLPEKFAGVGLARKIGMDEAINRFNILNNQNGIIISFDSDSICETNYLTEIENHFRNFPKTNGCNIHFEHPVKGTEFPDKVYETIIQYEMYLRYFVQSLRFIGFPYAFHTVGSCFAVKASAYIKQGGMNRKQAGEDFYFLNKIFQLENFSELNTTKVKPSPRPSNRVPFGTGATIKNMTENKINELLVYNFEAFVDLKYIFSRNNKLYKADKETINSFVKSCPKPIRKFIEQNNFTESIEEINNNVSNSKTFTKRFYSYFNAFYIIKLLNYTHKFYYTKIPVKEASKILVKHLTKEDICFDSDLKALEMLRKIED
ncbi:MAG: glycosyltransferase [Bacteroidales bacterium]|nr:glycosyltransferase [Bacteroidales bacterium]